MKQIASLFDYFKLAFAINKENRELYKPQVILIIMKTLLVVITGIIVYDYIMLIEVADILTEEMVFAKLFSTFGLYMILFIGSIFVKIAFEAGLYNMYKDCVKDGRVKSNSFSLGFKTYFAKFLLADVLMFLAWILMFIPYIIIGFVTMFAGFIIIPIIISIFTSMWKVSIVMDEMTVIDGFKRGFAYAKLNFWPLSFLIIIKNSFLNISSGGGGSAANNVSNFNSENSYMNNVGHNNLGTEYLPDATNFYDPSIETILGYVKLAFIILIPIISIAVVISSLIKMIFDVFFSLSIFVMYNESDKTDKIDLIKEVL